MPTSTPVNGSRVEANDNILNRQGDKEQSLFQICLNLRQRLIALPEVADYLMKQEEDADEDVDPVTLIWRTLRKGYPLIAIYNALSPVQPLRIDENRIRGEKQREKAATFKFVQACVTELKFTQEECFIITDLYGDDTTGFVKVCSLRLPHRKPC